MADPDYITAHKHSATHRIEIETSDICGCFYCTKMFQPVKIAEWIDDGETALCPICGIDSVIGSQSGYPITECFLNQMHRHWFGVQ